MDTTQFHAWYTVVMLVIFVGIFAWAYSGRRKSAFREAANLPFVEIPPDARADTQPAGGRVDASAVHNNKEPVQ